MGGHGDHVALSLDLDEEARVRRRDVLPLDDLGDADKSLELGNGELVERLALLLGELGGSVVLVVGIVGDVVVVVEQELALVAGVGLAGDVVLLETDAKLAEYFSVGSEGWVLIELVVGRSLDLDGCLGCCGRLLLIICCIGIGVWCRILALGFWC